MKIGVFGCSWVAGTWPTYYNLAEKIAVMQPQHTIYDYAFSGHSIQMILHLYEKFKHEHDFNIIKITSPARLTIFNNYDFENQRIFKTKNFSTWKNYMNYGDNIVRLSPRSVPNKAVLPYTLRSIKKMHKSYYAHMNPRISDDECMAITSYMMSSADYVYTHKHRYGHKLIKTSDIVSKYKSYVFDDGEHLDANGISLEAEWLIKNVIELIPEFKDA